MARPTILKAERNENIRSRMKARPESEWTPENVTARDIAADSSVTVGFLCIGCHLNVEFNIWKIGARLADTPIKRLRFRCQRCGVYPTSVKIARRTSTAGDNLLTFDLECKWDERVLENQRRSLERAGMIVRR